MRVLNLDIETFSEEDLKKCGMYKYVEHDSFEILLLSYSIDGKPVECVDLCKGEEIPAEVVEGILDDNVIKIAFNAQFERTCLSKLFNQKLRPKSWRCTMVKAGMLGLPMSLEGVGIALNTDTQKSAIGKKLIRIFCIPCKPTKANGFRKRNLPQHFPEQWAEFKDYCDIDVYSEMSVGEKISFFEVPEMEQRLYILDQEINDRGIKADKQLIEGAIKINKEYTERLIQRVIDITGIPNPKSVAQLKEWVSLEIDETVTTLKADAVIGLLKDHGNAIVQEVLQIRQQISKSSIKKYDSMLRMIGADGYIRGVLQFYGANRTGRWAGRGFQPQNLPKNKMLDLELAREIVRRGDLDTLELVFGDVSNVLSELIRTALIATEGYELLMSDFSAIEARVIAWYAQEKWRLDVFNTHGKIYEASGANMFKVPIEQVKKGSLLRDKAKIAELALGFQGGVNALIKMGSAKMGLSDEELPELVGKWRDANKKIVQFWYDVQAAAIECVSTGEEQRLRNLRFYMRKGIFFIGLPSGRSLAYLKPSLSVNKFGHLSLSFKGVNQKTRQWQTIPTYGGMLVENIVQGTSRDILGEKMLVVDEAGYLIRFHVHDELVPEVELQHDDPDYSTAVEHAINKIMSDPLSWSAGLPLGADTYCSPFYKKD